MSAYSELPLTPMLRQYYDLKAQAPSAILLFRCGDFYETYGEDAELAARELEITLTSKEAGEGHRIPMAGVPYHAVAGYLRTLIQKGYRVAISEQMEDPARAKGLVKREIVRIVTSGTITDPDLLEQTANNFILSITGSSNGAPVFGLAVADISTGEWRTTELSGPIPKLVEEIARIHPSECLLAPSLRSEKDLIAFLERERIPVAPFGEEVSHSRALRLLLSHLGVHSLDGFGCQSLPWAQSACAHLLGYLQTICKAEALALRKLATYDAGNCMAVDRTTARNLELFQTLLRGEREGSLLWVMDETATAMGTRKLRQWMERPLLDTERILERQEAVEVFVSRADLLAALRKTLGQIQDMERLTTRISNGTASPRDLWALMKSLEVVSSLKEDLATQPVALVGRLREGLDPMSPVTARIRATLKEDLPAGVREGGMIREGVSPELDELRQLRERSHDYLIALEAAERERTGIKSLKIGFNQVFGYYFEVTRPNLSLVPENYIRKQTLASAERFLTPELKELEARILGAQERIQTLEYDLFVALRDFVSGAADGILSVARHVAELDVLASFAHTASRYRFSRPKVTEGDLISIKEGRHPVVERITEEGFVPNDARLDIKGERLQIVTGPNMSGKSTYLRQVALIVLLAQMGSFVPAKEAEIGIVDKMFTRVGATDDLHLGQSTFLVEMKETAFIANHATCRSLLILDEIGRGTSTFDGLSIAWAVAEHLHREDRVGARTLFATHFHELTQLARYHGGIGNLRVSVKETRDQVAFLRKIVRGASDKSYGIYVAELAGLPREITSRAREILEQLERRNRARFSRSQWMEKSEMTAPSSPVQLSLPGLPEMMSPEIVEVVKEIRRLPVGELTPLEALNFLDRMQRKLSGQG
ncbi:MAG: DNA mismatch repair protein MutS [Armatimonadetes bacterium]|nr:DNA mismatch repair protein MutS [Armatimonadota bacterium]